MDEKTLKSAEVLFDLAYAEDVGDGDITTNNLIPGENKTAILVAKEKGVIAGLQVAEMVFKKFDKNIEWNVKLADGSKVEPGDILVQYTGNYRALLTGERKALNFLQRLSGIATYANKCMKEIEGHNVEILDTRKTLPGYRYLDKYAVRMGGASNHRFGLYDMVMIKDNHIQVSGGIKNAVNSIRSKVPKSIKIEVETTNMNQVQEALDADVDIIMLDNMSSKMMTEAVKLINKRTKIEASGNMTIKRIHKVASTGVDYISIGALTHSVKALDISQRIID
ncbi:MAG: carboxylating nicotinate-nucleotide diphosphorylase [Prolixibacteraceae bacterium]|jgi:nicotinate-nucleotide pyrophosphorylase (carboxylating)|nr:carboxylating nicotinate-nucleotide diphosphorylase [Prolixibacteraceae bacterium]MBT6765511.1 carboxylating nicotinate-nucleotide diphosphorylase [Prolixibacteraceae bacterium]MBT6999010.1 carboxylating nicotinate-nucleotide diphosphorylase [Prolixibacteraceae bacterium]MBT7394491.1 carboxylating nicotinate-nucleotide diphosphorylase [Prolixibacteraceae bacterium]